MPLKNLEQTHIDIEHGISYDCSYVEIDAMTERIETDEEFAERVAEIKHRQAENTRR